MKKLFYLTLIVFLTQQISASDKWMPGILIEPEKNQAGGPHGGPRVDCRTFGCSNPGEECLKSGISDLYVCTPKNSIITN